MWKKLVGPALLVGILWIGGGGATTYYIEIFPVRTEELGDKRPVLALTPGVGDIDIAVASELLEAGRAVSNGFVTPARTCLISSINRSYAMEEKIAMSDGRFDQQKLMKAVTDHARSTVFLDMNTLAQQAGSIVNAVMLGAIAGCGRLPLTTNQFEAAIRDDGKALDVNLRGFRAGYEAAQITGIDDAIARAEAYVAAGVDAIFLVGLKTRAELDKAAQAIRIPIILGGAGGELSDRDYLASRGVRVALQGHFPTPAAVGAVYDTLKALRDGQPVPKTTSIASAELMQKVTRASDYDRWTTEFL